MGIVILANSKFHFARVQDNFLKDPSNNKSIAAKMTISFSSINTNDIVQWLYILNRNSKNTFTNILYTKIHRIKIKTKAVMKYYQ